ncbi:MAG TPA: nuclear transport factor 2 family protein [Thermoanaerobaculia bacterium]|jgi:hypothetical protein
MKNNSETVGQLYAAFGRGDIPAILDSLDDDVQWEQWEQPTEAQKAGVPWLQPRRGKAGAREFFSIVSTMQFHAFDVRNLMAGGNQVAASVFVDVTSPTGKRIQDEEIHLWTFDADGKVIGFRYYIDEARQIAAAG